MTVMKSSEHHPMEIEGIIMHENGSVLPIVGQNPNIGIKRRDLSPNNENGVNTKCKQRKAEAPQAKYTNKDTPSFPEQEQYKVLIGIVIAQNGKTFRCWD